METRSFIPAAGHDAALPLYDPLTAVLGAQSRRKLLIERAGLSAGARVLDVGCGTGTLALAIKRAHPGVDVTAIDPDPLALARARRKAAKARVAVQFDQGFGDALPYADATFARVFSSFMLHHLERPLQQRLLTEALRVLAPGGSFHLIDFADKIDPDLRRAGFGEVRIEPQRRWLFSRIVYCSGVRVV